MNFKRAFIFTLALGIFFTIGFGSGYLSHDRLSSHGNGFALLQEAFGLVKNHGLRPLPTDPAMEYGMIRGMLQAYQDPYTIFVEPAQHELEGDALQGSFGGIGVRLTRDEDGNVILYPFPDSPAFQAGIRDGDLLVAVDEMIVTPEVTMDLIQAALRGPIGQVVRVQVRQSPGTEAIGYSIKREEIPLPSVTWRLDADMPGLGIIEINVIAASTPGEVEKAVNDLRQRQAQAYVLDLRNNFGGLLSAGVDIARLFLMEGVVMEHRYRDQDVEVFQVERPGPFVDLPLAVLVNENTASAAEIIAGALQVHQRAQIIGTPTYGKDTIQLVFELKDGSSLHVTSAQWWIPGLNPPIGESGLQPDIIVAQAPDPDQPDAVVKAAADALFR